MTQSTAFLWTSSHFRPARVDVEHVADGISAKDEETAWSIFSRYSDKSFRFTDCTSYALVRRLELPVCLAIDEDFRAFGLLCLPVLGADESYHRLLLSWAGAKSFGKNTLVGRARLGTSLSGDMPYYDQFALGGFQELSGYANKQFRGNQVAFGELVYYRQLATLTPPLGRGVYLGGSLEVGALRDTVEFLSEPKTRFGSSVFLGADTWLGPAYLGLGASGEGDSTAYFLLGRP